MENQRSQFGGLVSSTAAVTGTVLALVAVAAVLWSAADVLLLLFAGALFAVLLGGLSAAVSRAVRIGHAWALTIVLLAALGGALAVFFLVAPGIADQVDELRRSLPQALDRLRSHLNRYDWAQTILSEAPSRRQLLGSRSDLFERATGIFSTTLGALTSALVVFFFGLFLAADPGLYRDGVIRLFPRSRRERTGQVLDSIAGTLWWWLLAKFASMTVVGVLTWIGLAVLNVPLAFTLALIASLLTFIPNIGPILSAVPAMLLGLLDSPTTALWVAILFILIQTVESYLITPVFQQRAISLPPALVIAAQVLMGVLSGGIGLIVATPLTAALSVLVRELYIRDVLHDPPGTTPVAHFAQEN